MPTHKVREVVARLKSEGWKQARGRGKGSHRLFEKTGMSPITVPGGPGDDLKPGTYASIARSAGWK